MVVSASSSVTTPLLSICGPSGSGKSTLARALSTWYQSYVENPDSNPHLKGLLEESDNCDAAANQEWFLQHIGDFISRADSRSALVLDQDPAAIVIAYSQMFLDDGKISAVEYDRLFQQLLDIEERLRIWKCPRSVLFLDAPAEVLRLRVLQRCDELHTPSVKWFRAIRDRFTKLRTYFPNAISASTIDLSQEKVTALAKSMVEKRV